MIPSNCENLSFCSTKLIHVCKKLPFALDWGRANISRYIIYIFFNFGRGFCGSFPMLFPKTPASCCKKILNQFLLHCTFIYISSKSVSQIFKILFQTGDISIFVFHSVFLSRYIQLKSSLSAKKNISIEIWDTL